ncbi:MAG: SDR family oxidoreductase, partial [Acidimicrobiia bacterium]
MKDLDGKVAIVTGAGRIGGIGQGAALELAKWGVRIVATDVARRSADTDWDGRSTTAEDMTGLHSLVEQVESVGSQAIALSVDVTNAEDASGCVEAAVEAFGQVDILVNNAGVPNGIGNFLKIPDSVWEMSWQVNVMGMVRMSRAVVPVMKPRGGGSIINNASVAGIRAMPE